MIRKWLLKHWWVNESLKTVIALFFSWLSFVFWEGGKLASTEISSADSYKLMIFGIFTGVLGMLALFVFVDTVYSIIGIIKERR